jgi:uncharacterized protein YdaU (DUF1376 family)
MSLPWMPLDIAAYRKDTAHLGAGEHGAYLLLIFHYWATGSLPDEDRQLARIAAMTTAEWRRARGVVQAFFYDGWKHKRIDKELARAADISSKRSASARKRHSNSSANADASGHANVEQLDTHARASKPPQPQSPEEGSSLREEVRKRATRLADGWMPSEEDGRYAIDKGLTQAEAQHEFEKFRNYWQAKSGQQATKTDWSKTWRNWILTTIERKGKPHANGGNRGRQSLGDIADQLADEARQLELAAGIGRSDDPLRSH